MSTPADRPAAPCVLRDHAEHLHRLAATVTPTLAALLRAQADATRRLADVSARREVDTQVIHRQDPSCA